MYVQGWVAVQISLKGRLTSVHVNFASAFCKICRALRSVMHAVPWARNATNFVQVIYVLVHSSYLQVGE